MLAGKVPAVHPGCCHYIERHEFACTEVEPLRRVKPGTSQTKQTLRVSFARTSAGRVALCNALRSALQSVLADLLCLLWLAQSCAALAPQPLLSLRLPKLLPAPSQLPAKPGQHELTEHTSPDQAHFEAHACRCVDSLELAAQDEPCLHALPGPRQEALPACRSQRHPDLSPAGPYRPNVCCAAGNARAGRLWHVIGTAFPCLCHSIQAAFSMLQALGLFWGLKEDKTHQQPRACCRTSPACMLWMVLPQAELSVRCSQR